MKCPNCSASLSKHQIGDLEIDVCRDGCAGIWFDRDELYKLDDGSEGKGDSVFLITPRSNFQNPAPKQCPHCAHEVLVKQFLDAANSVQIDQCWSCSGVWMDHGELQKIRGQYSGPEARVAAANQAASAAINQLQSALKQHTEETQASEAEQKNRRAAWFVGKFLGIKELLDNDKK